MINSLKLLLFNKSFCVEPLHISEYGLYFCESSFIQNDSMFAEFGTFFCCFAEKCFLCSRKKIKLKELWQKIDKN